MVFRLSARCLVYSYGNMLRMLVGWPNSQVVNSLRDRPHNDVGACARPLASAQSLGWKHLPTNWKSVLLQEASSLTDWLTPSRQTNSWSLVAIMSHRKLPRRLQQHYNLRISKQSRSKGKCWAIFHLFPPNFLHFDNRLPEKSSHLKSTWLRTKVKKRPN
jgi:hypothetical protein